MFASIRGILVYSSPQYAIVEAGGIGFKIYIPANAFGKLPQLNQPTTLHTAYVVRELSHTLYGFMVPQERDLFESLMGVTGVGPKLALSMVGHIPMHELQRAISHHDIATICKVPGIGKKIAERLIIEMKDKLSSLFPPDPSDLAVFAANDPQTQKINDAMGALINLGYNQMTAQKAIKKTLKEQSDEVDLANLITAALKNV